MAGHGMARHEGEKKMRILGNLTGLTPKDKAEGQIIEIKIITNYDKSILMELGDCFGAGIVVEITNQQQKLPLDRR